MPYASWSVVFNEQPSASKWNILGTNDAYFSSYIDRVGFPIQVQSNATTAVATGTTIMPLDDTVPQNTEGDQYMTQAITPTSTASILEIDFIGLFASSLANDNISVALFQDATAGALAATSQNVSANGSPYMISLKHRMVAGTTSSTTFKIRAGGNNAATRTFNGISGGRLFGAITKSVMNVTEYRP